MDAQELQSIKNKFSIIGNDPALNEALEIAVAVAPTDLTVLVSGESGVGKEAIPQIIYRNSLRKNAKCLTLNCGGIAESLVDSELFGHEKGAFTGAYEMRKGYFEEADGGTLVLDEIGELPLPTQAKLLRVLQSGEFIRVGSSKVLKCNVRVIASTNRDLLHAVSLGRFREDLYYRLSPIVIHVPALRDRKEDIPLLFRKFASDFSERNNTSKITLSAEAERVLKAYRWPGNIRQLQNIAWRVSVMETERLTAFSSKAEISAETLLRYMPREEGNVLPVPVGAGNDGMTGKEKEAIFQALLQLRQEVDYIKKVLSGAAPVPGALVPPRSESPAVDPSVPAEEEPEEQDFTSPAAPDEPAAQEAPAVPEEENLSIGRQSEELIRKALARHGGNRKAAAKDLGISERTLYRKIDAYGL